MSTTLKSHLVERSRRLRTMTPEDWNRFSNLWMAFNTIYGGELDRVERDRVMACIRNHFDEPAAGRILSAVTEPIDRILKIPPGDMRLNREDANFRMKSERSAKLYQDKKETAVERLAAVGSVLYQVRCNLLHGSKDPDNSRDVMLVRESMLVLKVLIPALEEQLM